jgi:hypothetical protein
VTLAILSGLGLKSTLYGFDNNAVNETDVTLNVNEYVSIGNQTLVANDSSWRNISNINLNVPEGYGSYGHLVKTVKLAIVCPYRSVIIIPLAALLTSESLFLMAARSP